MVASYMSFLSVKLLRVSIMCSLMYLIDKEKSEEQKKEEQKAPMFVVEVYDASNTQFKYVREIPLYKNEDLEPFIKQKNSVDFLKESSFATNGSVLMIHAPKRVYFFDLRTGIRF